MAFKKSDGDAIRSAIVEAIKETLSKIDSRESGSGGAINLRESAEQRDKRERRERKESKRLKESGREAFMNMGLSKREAKAAAAGRPEYYRG